jgi:hypothetical protein
MALTNKARVSVGGRDDQAAIDRAASQAELQRRCAPTPTNPAIAQWLAPMLIRVASAVRLTTAAIPEIPCQTEA